MNDTPPIAYSTLGRGYALLTCSIANFISHNTEGAEPVEIIANTDVVGDTATKFLHQGLMQQLQLRRGGNGTTTIFRSNGNPKLLRVAEHGMRSTCEETQ